MATEDDIAPTAENPLTETLDHVKEEVEGSKVYFRDILISLNHRGFGHLMMAPALLALLPTGAVPGIPALCGLSLCIIGGQVLIGRHYPWIPQKIGNISIQKKQLFSMIERAKPVMKFLDRFVDERLAFLSNKFIDMVIAFICFLLGCAMIAVGFIPFLPSILALPVLLFAMGTVARDGVMILGGFAFTCAAAIFILWMSGLVGGEDRLHIDHPVFITQSNYKIDRSPVIEKQESIRTR